jgi:hypothetical protein
MIKTICILLMTGYWFKDSDMICLPVQTLQDTTIRKIQLIESKYCKLKLTGISATGSDSYPDSGYYPKSLYFNIRIAGITGLSADEAKQGKYTATILDENNTIIPLIKEIKYYVAKTDVSTDRINILVSIPLNPTDKNNMKYRVHFLWEAISTGKKAEADCFITGIKDK